MSRIMLIVVLVLIALYGVAQFCNQLVTWHPMDRTVLGSFIGLFIVLIGVTLIMEKED